MDYSETEKTSLLVALCVVIFSMIAIIAFIFAHGGIVFYLVAAVAVILELYMAYRISQETKALAPRKADQKRKPRK